MTGQGLRWRSFETEILDDPAVPEEVRRVCYKDLARIHRWLGNSDLIVDRIRTDPRPVKRVLDIGCAHGELLEKIRQELAVQVIGVDVHPPLTASVPILECDAVRQPLPEADVAICTMTAHHLSETELAMLIQNVARSCRRLLLLDLVRHSIPLVLFRIFVAPFVHAINVADGICSIKRAFTVQELHQIVRQTLTGTHASFTHEVAALSVRQLVDIHFS